MRTIKFRGKRIDNGEWVTGSLFNSIWRKANDGSRVYYIFPDDMLDNIDGDCWDDFVSVAEDYEVIPSTVGQFTGLKDKHGKEIYEGDVLKENITKAKYIIEWRAEIAAFVMVSSKTDQWYDMMFAQHIKVIGNINDNPELLKGGEE